MTKSFPNFSKVFLLYREMMKGTLETINTLLLCDMEPLNEIQRNGSALFGISTTDLTSRSTHLGRTDRFGHMKVDG